MNNPKTTPEIFTSKERDENEERKRQLIELVASREAMLLVGAGSSARVSYVTWEGLLKKLEDLADRCGCGFEKDEEKRVKKPLEYAEDIKSHIYEKMNGLGIYHDLLCETFEPKSPGYDEFHRLLIDLPVRGILTTNYDTVLEEALSTKKREAEINEERIPFLNEKPLLIGQGARRFIHRFLLARSDDPELPQRIAHLHGIYEFPDKIILSAKDYIKAYGQSVSENNAPINPKEVWTLHRKLLWAVLATRRVMFIGFSMDDPYFNEMLEIVGEDLWVRNKSIHFAIMGISRENIKDSKDKADRLRVKYGVETVFYEVVDNKHRGLERIVADIAKECEVEVPETLMPEASSDDNDRSETEELEPLASELNDVLDQLKQMSRRMARRIGDED